MHDNRFGGAAEDEVAHVPIGSTTVHPFIRKKPVRAPFPAHLPRERVVISGPSACPCCGGRLAKLGETITETLEVVPRRWKVILLVSSALPRSRPASKRTRNRDHRKLARRTGDNGMRAALAEVRRRHHRRQGRLDRPPRIGEEIGDAGQRLVRLGVEHVQDGADEQRMARLLPVVPLLERPFRIDQDVGDVLDIAHFPFAAADLDQRIVGRAVGIGRITARSGPAKLIAALSQ
jgi:hypothetical protein